MNAEISTGKKPVIICVDDEKMILDSLNRQLQRTFKDDYDFEFAESAEEAIQIIDELYNEGLNVVMIISDQIMPGMAGDQFLIHLHKKFPEQIKILLTGQASLDSAVNAINKANLYRYITKPWVESDFMLTVEKGLKQYNLTKQTQLQLEMFKRYVPQQFLECLSKKDILDIHLGDHVQKEMSILFTDIRNFSRISEILTSEEIYSFVNNYLSYVEPAIDAHNGFVDKFVGDAIMALFFNPEDALLAALDIQKAIKRFNDDFNDEKYHPISSGIGLHTGSLMLGIVGVENRLQSTVIADAVNTASRIEDITSKIGGLIIASGDFVDKLRETSPNLTEDHFRYLGKVLVKGKKQILPVYEIFSMENDLQAGHKISTKKIFVEGLNLFFNKEFAESCVKFKAVVMENPEDKFAHIYLNLAAKYMLDGVPDDWEGIYFTDSPPSKEITKSS